MQCQFGHSFEGWFRSAEDFTSQNDKGLLICPTCDNNCISRLPSAAHIQPTKATVDRSKTQSLNDQVLNVEVKKKLLQVAEQILKDSEDVGDQFANEARRIHRKQSDMRTIHGTATSEESKELKEEGIDVVPLPFLPIKKKPQSLQ